MGRDYEGELRAVLEKVGGETSDNPETPAVDDSMSAAGHQETAAQDSPEDSKLLAEREAPKPFSARNLFVHHDAHPVVLDIQLLDKYGTDWFEWEPETLWSEIMDDFRSPSISDHVRSKIQAVRTIHISDWVFKKWEVFCPVIQALNNNIPDFEIMRKPTISQLFAGVDMMTMVRNDEEFSQEVQQFCGAALLDDGVVAAPQPVSFCQDEILQIQQELGVEVDPAPVREKYRQVVTMPAERVVLEENPVDIQVAKLIIARDYMRFRRQQMQEQLRALR